MLKIILPICLLSSFAQASKLACQLSEVFSGQQINRELLFETGADNKSKWNVDFAFGPGQVFFDGINLTVTLTDPTLRKPVKAQMGALDGQFSRIQLIPDGRSNDYLMMDCESSGVLKVRDVTGASCSLLETAGSSQIETAFEVPLAANGHDIFPLPEAKLAPISGWVMVYNGILMTNIQNVNLLTSVTAIANWGQPTFVSWYPSPQNVQVAVSCQPKVQ